MTADDTPAVPDTEAEREALAFLRPCDRAPGDLDAWLRESGHARDHAATIVRAALARDVPAGRDLTAQDVRRAPAEHGAAGVADYLNRIARPARDVPAPTDDPRGVAAVLALHKSVDGPLDSNDNPIQVCDHCIDGYEEPRRYPCPTVQALDVAVSDRAGTSPTGEARTDRIGRDDGTGQGPRVRVPDGQVDAMRSVVEANRRALGLPPQGDDR